MHLQLPILVGHSLVKNVLGCNTFIMLRSIGFLIVLWGLSKFFTSSFTAFDQAATAIFSTMQTAAEQTQEQMIEINH